MPPRLVSIISLAVLQLLSSSLWALEAGAQQPSAADTAANGGYLSPDQAFQFSYQQQGEELRLHWQIAPGYYLYQKRLKLSDTKKTAIGFETNSRPEEKDDPNFGLVQVFHNQLDLALQQPVLEDNRLIISYQGCAEEGLCYPPKRRTITLNPRLSTAATPQAIIPSSNASKIKTSFQSTALVMGQSASTAAVIDQQDISQDAGAITRILTNADGYWVLLTFLLLGLGLTFTPCVLPMVPILAGIIAGQGAQITLRKGIGLSVAYVLGMSVTYTLAGVLVGFFGAHMNLQAALQTPLALMMFAGLFTLLALSMFGFYELQLPAAVRDRLDRMGRESKGGQYVGVALMGLVSALVVSPCVSAPLAGALVYISTTGDALMGGASLFALSMGMGLPLILVGAGGGKLLPKAGGWMLEVKAFFGVLMLGVAISLLSRLLPGPVSLLLWALLAIVYAIHLGGFGQLESLSSWGKTRRGLSVALLVYGISLLLAGLAGQEDPLRPLAFVSAPGSSSSVAEQPLFARYSSVAALEGALQQARLEQMPVVVDLYADWCASCKQMEKEVFNQTAVKSLARQVTFLQLDITNNTDEQTGFLQQHGLFGPPSLLFYQPSGAELVSARVQGELAAPEFIQQLQKVL
tara:strand:- start:7782 stop:9683 length:1902 start_codon:yes stop_codon:yes gene_type:complete